MDESWQMKAPCPNEPSSLWFPLSGSINPTETASGQCTHPYISQEVCVIERTVRKEPVPQNLLNLSSQSFHSKVGMQELPNPLLASLTGNSQYVQSAFQQTPASRSSFSATNQQWYATKSTTACESAGGWPVAASGSLSFLGRGAGLDAAGIAADFSQGAQAHGLPQNIRIGAQGNMDSMMLMARGLEMYKQALSMSNEAEIRFQCSVPPWITDERSQRIWGMQAVQQLSPLEKIMQPIPDALSGPNNLHISGTPQSRPRVYCSSLSGSLICGELILTETKRLGVLCSCHNWLMSVAKFSEHAGLFTINPGSAVQIEGGETLVEWRKAFFSQFGVKVPEDHVGWEWNDLSSLEAAHSRHKAVLGQNWQKEVEIFFQMDNTLVKNRVRQAWDTSPGLGRFCPTGHDIFKAGLIANNPGENGSQDLDENGLRNFGKSFSGSAETLNRSPVQNVYENLSKIGAATPIRSFRGNGPGASFVSGSVDLRKNGSHLYVPGIDNPLGFACKGTQKGSGFSGWNDGRGTVQIDKDIPTSHFELRLGQPSQQNVSVGPSLMSLQSQLSAGAIDRNRLFIDERVAQQAWDQRIQQNVQHSMPGRLAAITGVLGQSNEGVDNPNWQNYADRSGQLDKFHVDQTKAEGIRGFGPSSQMHPLKLHDAGSSPIYPVFRRQSEDSAQVKSKVGATSGPITVKSNTASHSLVNSINDEQSRLELSGLDYETPLNQIRTDVPMEQGSSFGDIRNYRSTLHMLPRVGTSDGMQSVGDSHVPPPLTLMGRASVSMTSLAEKDSSNVESINMKGSVNHTITSSLGACDNYQTTWIKEGRPGAMAALALPSQDPQQRDHTSVKMRQMDQGPAPLERVVEDGGKVEVDAQNVSTSTTGISDVTTTLVHANKNLVNQELCVLEGSNDRNDISMASFDATAKVVFEKHPSFQAESEVKCKDSDLCDPPCLASDIKDQSHLQYGRTLLHSKNGEQNGEAVVIEDKSSEGDMQGEECKCMKFGKDNEPGMTTSRILKSEQGKSNPIEWTADSGVKELMRSDVVDESSGIGNCCSSDEVNMDARTSVRPLSSGRDAQVWESQTSIVCPSSSHVDVSETAPNSFKASKFQGGKVTVVRQEEDGFRADKVTGKAGKKRRKTMKWKHLDVVSPSESTKQPVRIGEKKMATSSFSFHDKHAWRKSVETDTCVVLEKSLKCRRSDMKCKASVKPLDIGLHAKKVDPVDADHRLGLNTSKLVLKLSQGMNGKQATKASMLNFEKLCGTVRSIENQKKNVEKELTKGYSTLKVRLPSGHKSSGASNVKYNEQGDPLIKSYMDIKTVRNSPGRHSLKAAKMVSLSAIMKLPAEGRGLKDSKVTLKRKLKPEPEYSTRQGKDLPSSKRLHVFESTSREKTLSAPTNVREIRKRSLWELTAKERPNPAASQVKFVEDSSAPRRVLSAKHNLVVPENSNANLTRVRHGQQSSSKCNRKDPMRISVSSQMVDFHEKEVLGNSRFSMWNPVSESPYVPNNSNISTSRFGASVIEENMNDGRFPLKIVKKKKNVNEAVLNTTDSFLGYIGDHGRDLLRLGKKFKAQDGSAKMVHHQHISNSRGFVPSLEDHHSNKNSTNRKDAHGEFRPRSIKKKRMKRVQPDLQGSVERVCCVCGSSRSQSLNILLQCNRCGIRVHQACYGVAKVPRRSWMCRPCKAHAINAVCVLCGYAKGAMTRAKKSQVISKGLLLIWGEEAYQRENSTFDKENIKRETEKNVSCDHLKRDSLGANFFPQHVTMNCSLLSDPCADRFIMKNGVCDGRVRVKVGKDWNAGSHFKGNLADASAIPGQLPNSCNREDSTVYNSITAAASDLSVVQWVHVVCALWMPGTRCVNVGTMSAFDVSGVTSARRKLVCSICNRAGGACIQCRVAKCSTPFHPWCAHGKGLLQNESFGGEENKVAFLGRCVLHGTDTGKQSDMIQLADVLPVTSCSKIGDSTCARTEGYERKEKSLRNLILGAAVGSGSMIVSQEQISAWLHINDRKTCTRRIIKLANSDLKTDHREYLRFKQEQGWKRLSVYKSGIHALGLYTAEVITKGEMVVEFIGEIINAHVAEKREMEYHHGRMVHHNGACYFFRIDKQSVIDATRKGGISRFVNHSCSSNCIPKVICVNNQKKVVFFSERDIYAGEEITYDYRLNYENDSKIPCFCSSFNCRGYL